MMTFLSDCRIKIDPPKRPKKITGTRFAAIAGLNKWTTPFKTWCEITRTWEEPFEDTIYTIAGKTIEPKQADYMRRAYFMTNLVSPTDVYGENYFSKTYGDFFHDRKIFGGMWDYLLVDKDGKPTTVLEMKTTKRAEDWSADIPEYYALQAALYAYLLGVDNVIMVCSFLDEADYERPDQYVPSAANTVIRPFYVSERYPDFEMRVAEAESWWRDHVLTGVSPQYDEKADAEPLKALRTNHYNPETDLAATIAEAEDLMSKIDELSKPISPLQERLKILTEIIKKAAIDQFRDGTKNVTIPGGKCVWTITKSATTTIDKAALKTDGLLDKYTTQTVSYRLTTSNNKEDK